MQDLKSLYKGGHRKEVRACACVCVCACVRACGLGRKEIEGAELFSVCLLYPTAPWVLLKRLWVIIKPVTKLSYTRRGVRA